MTSKELEKLESKLSNEEREFLKRSGMMPTRSADTLKTLHDNLQNHLVNMAGGIVVDKNTNSATVWTSGARIMAEKLLTKVWNMQFETDLEEVLGNE